LIFQAQNQDFTQEYESHCLKVIPKIVEKNDVDEAGNKKLYFYLRQEIE
jgi:hypothetical protein